MTSAAVSGACGDAVTAAPAGTHRGRTASPARIMPSTFGEPGMPSVNRKAVTPFGSSTTWLPPKPHMNGICRKQPAVVRYGIDQNDR